MKSFPYVLCVIDMQHIFPASRSPKVIRAVSRLIRTAIFDRAFIVVAEYTGQGPTHSKLTDMIRRYPHTASCHANALDKSGSIEVVLANVPLMPRAYFKVCGVNTDACVQATVDGLHRKFPAVDIYLVKKACNTDTTSDSEYVSRVISSMLETHHRVYVQA